MRQLGNLPHPGLSELTHPDFIFRLLFRSLVFPKKNDKLPGYENNLENIYYVIKFVAFTTTVLL
jgi:hypothetical protein